MNLSEFERFIITMGLSFLTTLKPKIKNPVELDALDATIRFLQDLLIGKVA